MQLRGSSAPKVLELINDLTDFLNRKFISHYHSRTANTARLQSSRSDFPTFLRKISSYLVQLRGTSVPDVLELIDDVTDFLLGDVISVFLRHAVNRAYSSRYLAEKVFVSQLVRSLVTWLVNLFGGSPSWVVGCLFSRLSKMDSAILFFEPQ